MKKRILSILLAFCLCLSLLPTVALAAEPDVWDGSTQTPSGSGTSESDPYLISTGEELAWLSTLTGGESKSYFVKLTNDIILNEGTFDKSGNLSTSATPHAWTPTKDAIWHIDGNNHSISGLYINSNVDDNVGLFSYLRSGSYVNNLTIKNSYVTASQSDKLRGVGVFAGQSSSDFTNCAGENNIVSANRYATGGIVGFSNGGSFNGVHTSGSISGSKALGGLVGWVFGDTVFKNCWNEASVTGGKYCGGIVGDGGNHSDCYNCANLGSGGITGSTGRTIKNCYILSEVESYGGAAKLLTTLNDNLYKMNGMSGLKKWVMGTGGYPLPTGEPFVDTTEYYDVWLDGVRVGERNQEDILENGLASYDKNTKTLYLHDGLVVTNPYNKSLLYTEGDINLCVDGSVEFRSAQYVSSGPIVINLGRVGGSGDLKIYAPTGKSAAVTVTCAYVEYGIDVHSLTLDGDVSLTVRTKDTPCFANCNTFTLLSSEAVLDAENCDEDGRSMLNSVSGVILPSTNPQKLYEGTGAELDCVEQFTTKDDNGYDHMYPHIRIAPEVYALIDTLPKSLTVSMTEANTQTALSIWAAGEIRKNGIDSGNSEITVSGVVSAVAGSYADPDGTDGSFTVTVKLTKNGISKTTTIPGTITATANTAPPRTAAVGNVTVSGTTGTAIADTEVNITLTNDKFKAIAADTDVTSWFINLPDGLEAKVKTAVNADDTTATITISGTPTAASDAVMQIKLPAANLVSSADLTVTANANAKFNISAPTYTVTITAGANMTLASGNANQTVEQESAITSVVYTAADGYYFPTDYAVEAVNGISVTRNSYTQITVSGTPTANTTITLTPTTAKTKEETPTATFDAGGEADGKLTGISSGIKYSIDGGETWKTSSGTSEYLFDVSADKDIKVYMQASDPTKLDSDIQTIDITKAAAPTGVIGVACTTSANNNGKLQNVTTAMEYREPYYAKWKKCTGTEVTGLAPGIYRVCISATGTVLTSDYVKVTVAEYSPTAHIHSWATAWSKDKTHHWHECTAEGCYVTDNAEKGSYAAHTYDQQNAAEAYKASDATCMAKATYYKSCVCGAKGTETFESGEVNASNHTFGAWIDEVPATCKTTGTKGHKDCTDCNKHFDADGNEITDLTISVDPDNHEGTLGDWVKTDPDKHWKKYSCCGAKFGEAAHDYDQEIATADYKATDATCTAKATYYKSCVCGATGTETFESGEVNASNHTFGAWINEVPATCKTTGTKGHKDCTGCNKHFDADGNEITDLTIPVDPNNHTFGDWQHNRLYHWKICATCGEKVDKARHDYGTDRTCDICGYVKPRTSSSTTPSQSTDTTKSADTGDMGIALYAGMAILSLTGGAWVVNKKRKSK